MSLRAGFQAIDPKVKLAHICPQIIIFFIKKKEICKGNERSYDQMILHGQLKKIKFDHNDDAIVDHNFILF